MKKIKLPFVSRKKYEIALNNYKIMSQARQQMENISIDSQKKYNDILDTNREMANRMEFIGIQLDDLKKENKRLKTLLTKNGINYKKER